MLLQVRYHICIFRRDAVWKFCPQSRRCCLAIIYTQHKYVIHALKTHLFVHPKSCGYTIYFCMNFIQYLLALKHHNPMHRSSTPGPYSSLKASGHVGCWVEFHAASLSEGWVLVYWIDFWTRGPWAGVLLAQDLSHAQWFVGLFHWSRGTVRVLSYFLAVFH